MAPDPRAVRATAGRQYDVLSRSQLLDLGATPDWISHQVETGRWRRLFPGTYVIHTGSPSWKARAQAAILYAGRGAALSHGSAGYVHDFLSAAPTRLDVCVAECRRVAPQPGLVIHRRRRTPSSGGRLRAIDRAPTVLDLIGLARDEDEVVGVVCAAARARTWPFEIRRALEAVPRVRHRALLLDLLADVADGVESPLERRYHHDVERRHGLPRSTLQFRQRLREGWIRSDARYDGLGVRTELDGALAHPNGRTDADTWRDNAVLIASDEITLRYRWVHVAVRPCEVALQVEEALVSRGWTGRARPCGPGCAVG